MYVFAHKHVFLPINMFNKNVLMKTIFIFIYFSHETFSTQYTKISRKICVDGFRVAFHCTGGSTILISHNTLKRIAISGKCGRNIWWKGVKMGSGCSGCRKAIEGGGGGGDRMGRGIGHRNGMGCGWECLFWKV